MMYVHHLSVILAIHLTFQQTVLPVSGQAAVGNQSVILPAGGQGNQSVLTQTGLQFIGQATQSPFIAQQQLITDQSGTQHLSLGKISKIVPKCS